MGATACSGICAGGCTTAALDDEKEHTAYFSNNNYGSNTEQNNFKAPLPRYNVHTTTNHHRHNSSKPEDDFFSSNYEGCGPPSSVFGPSLNRFSTLSVVRSPSIFDGDYDTGVDQYP